jgi:hypothetical protein
MTRTLSIALLLTACGGGSKETDEPKEVTLTCAVIESDWCWSTAVEEAALCLDDEQTGVWTSDRTSCDYADGSRVDFDTAVPTDVFDNDTWLWSFTVYDGSGAECARFVETDTGLTLTTASGTVSESISGFAAITMTCPGGEELYNNNAFDLFECEGGSLPGYGYSGDADISWSLLGDPRPDEYGQVFTCYTE